MKISVALATYNGERFIAKQLASLAQQTLLPHELVVSDDGSTDRTLEIVEAFSRWAPFPMRIFRNDVNLGFALNFLRAASLCSGECLAFCDQDDVWMPNKLEKCAEVLQDKEIVLLIHSAKVIDETGAELGWCRPSIKRSRKLIGSETPPLVALQPPGFAMVLKHRIVDELWNVWPHTLYDTLPKRHLLGHDKLLYCIARDFGYIYFERATLSFFRTHGGNATTPRSAFAPWRRRIREEVMRAYLARAEDYREAAERYGVEERVLRAICERRRYRSLVELEQLWHDTRRNLELRARLYERRSVEYWRCYFGMLRRRSYSARRKGGLGIRSAIKDAAIGCVTSLLFSRSNVTGNSAR
ncbi:MAG: glycosyltransferase [Candidatus Entotheonellia bacterium]